MEENAGAICHKRATHDFHFSRRYLKEAVTLSLSGRSMLGGPISEKALVSNFELLNLVPTYDQQQKRQRENLNGKRDSDDSTKWRRVGLVLGRKVHLDTIVW